MVFGQLVMPVQCGTAAGGGCPSTALYRHDQLAKYHPVPWLRWPNGPNVSWHQSIVNLSWTYRGSIVNLIIVHLSWIYRKPIANLSWTYPRCQQFEVLFEEINLFKSWNFVSNGSIWLGVTLGIKSLGIKSPAFLRVFTMGSWIHDGFAVNILPWTFAVSILAEEKQKRTE